MKQTLRVLPIGDSEADAELACRLLADAGYVLHSERVENASQMRAALQASEWDVIISDGNLSRFAAFGALAVLRESGRDTPLLVISATIGEAAAVALIKAGASDFLLKDDLGRLAGAVEREIRKAREQRERRDADEHLALALAAAELSAFDLNLQPGTVDASVQSFLDRVHIDDRERVHRSLQRAAIEPGGQFRVEYRPSGTEAGTERTLCSAGRASIDSRGQATRLIGVTYDVTDQRLPERARSEESIARLAGGVAHDFNNLLTVIAGFAQLAQRGLPEGHSLRKAISQITKAADRGTELTRRLVAFSKPDIGNPADIPINEVLAGMQATLRRLTRESVELQFVPDPRVGLLRADPAHLGQIVATLAVNACDAMQSGGVLRIETSSTTAEEAFRHTPGTARKGAYIAIAVSDTGHGMSAETKARIFEPFFTTKTSGKGTGLGLATAYGIVRECGGAIRVDSEPGHGSTFTIFLPAGQEEFELPPAAAEETEPGVSETILLVDDQAAVRELVREELEMSGYRVLDAASGREALEIAERHRGEIHLRLADIVMSWSPDSMRNIREYPRCRCRAIRITIYAGDSAGSRAK